MQFENLCIFVWDLKTTYCMKSIFFIGKQKVKPIVYYSCFAFSYNEYIQKQMHLQIQIVTFIKTPTYFSIKMPSPGSYKTKYYKPNTLV
jgi:predicted DNA-binding protein (UPF0278 family)